MVNRDRIISALNTYLDVGSYDDYNPIGLQVEGGSKVSKITLGVSAGMELFEKAVAQGSQMVIVHHGMFWKNESRVLRGALKERVRFLLDHELTLLGYHLPLDAHGELGNNARIVRLLGALRGPRFGAYHGVPIGWSGTFKRARPLEKIVAQLSELAPSAPMVFDSGPEKIKRFGVVTGGAGDLFHQAIDEGLDLYITGEPYEPARALCRETGTNFIALGHHNSEKTGVIALAGWLEKKFRIQTRFIDVPNPA